MALNASGTLSIAGVTAGQSIELEFQGTTTAQLSMSQLYRGGSIVTANNTNVPTSGAISLNQFYSAQAFGGQTNTHSTAGSGTDTIPNGAATVVIEVWGASAGGSGGTGSGCGVDTGSRGGAGGYSRSSYSVVGHNGQTIAFTCGTGGLGGLGLSSTDGTASTSSSGSLAITTMNCNGGKAPTISGGGNNGAPGTSSGGNVVNTTPSPSFTAPTGINGAGNNGGTAGALGAGHPGGAGGDGVVVFRYT